MTDKTGLRFTAKTGALHEECFALADFRRWQEKHNTGGDFIVFSDVLGIDRKEKIKQEMIIHEKTQDWKNEDL